MSILAGGPTDNSSDTLTDKTSLCLTVRAVLFESAGLPVVPRSSTEMESVLHRLEPLWAPQIVSFTGDFQEVKKLVPVATDSQAKKALTTFMPPDAQIASAALRNYLNLPVEGASVRIWLPVSPPSAYLFLGSSSWKARGWNTQKQHNSEGRSATS